LTGTTEERTIFWPGRAMAAKERRVRLGVGRREMRRRVSGEAEANLVKELLMSMSRYVFSDLDFRLAPRGAAWVLLAMVIFDSGNIRGESPRAIEANRKSKIENRKSTH
jgi:hypothetical protein